MSRRSRELKPLTDEHQQALLLAFQLKRGLTGHAETAGAPKDLAGLLAIARRYEDGVFATHTRAEEELLGAHLAPSDLQRLKAEHAEMRHLLDSTRGEASDDLRVPLLRFAELLERHVRWEERELFPACEAVIGADAMAQLGDEIERRLVLARAGARAAARRAS